MWLELILIIMFLYSTSLCTGGPNSIAACLKKRRDAKERTQASGAKCCAIDGLKEEQPTQTEEEPPLQLTVKPPTDETYSKENAGGPQENQKKKDDTIVGFKSAGPDERAFTIVAKSLQQPDAQEGESMDTVDPFKYKSKSDIAIRKSKMLGCRDTQATNYSSSNAKKKAENGSKQSEVHSNDGTKKGESASATCNMEMSDRKIDTTQSIAHLSQSQRTQADGQDLTSSQRTQRDGQNSAPASARKEDSDDKMDAMGPKRVKNVA